MKTSLIAVAIAPTIRHLTLEMMIPPEVKTVKKAGEDTRPDSDRDHSQQ